ncbi:MAG: hypothetical protein J6U43_05830 [Bacteroidales bacterium]|nr:hypothetical protein [Bacteroidales bacterium]
MFLAGAISAIAQSTEAISDTMTVASAPSRGLKQHTFVPKGQWIVGGSISYSQQSEKNYQFLIVEGINGQGYSFNASPMFSYMIADNMGLGGRFSYGRSLVKINSANINLSDEMNFSIGDLYSLSHSYTGMVVLRNYISIGNNMRFGLFNETQLLVGGSQSKLASGSGDAITGTYETGFTVGVNLAPGITAFINDFIAVEVNVGLLGFQYTSTHQLTDQVYEGNTHTTSANFQINIFSLGLGLAFYI